MFGFRWRWWTLSSALTLTLPAPAVYPSALDDIETMYQTQLTINEANSILTYLKILHFLPISERLGLLTRTIQECNSSILSIVVLLIILMVGYSLTALTLFGTNIENYRNVGVCISTLLRTLLGENDYDAMEAVNKYLTAFFYWSYVVFGLFLLLNFIIAVLSNTFSRISGKAHANRIDEAILREAKEWKMFFKASTQKKLWRLLLSGRTPASMMRKMVEDIDEYAKSRPAKNDVQQRSASMSASAINLNVDASRSSSVVEGSPLGKGVTIMRTDFESVVRAEVIEGLGSDYIDMLWEILWDEFEEDKKSSEEGKKDLRETVRETLQVLTDDQIADIDSFDQELLRLEELVTKLLNKYDGVIEAERHGSIDAA